MSGKLVALDRMCENKPHKQIWIINTCNRLHICKFMWYFQRHWLPHLKYFIYEWNLLRYFIFKWNLINYQLLCEYTADCMWKFLNETKTTKDKEL